MPSSVNNEVKREIPAPRPERRAAIVRHVLGLAVARHRLLEGLDHHLGALGVIDPCPMTNRAQIWLGPARVLLAGIRPKKDGRLLCRWSPWKMFGNSS
jgi:hypothetical protein